MPILSGELLYELVGYLGEHPARHTPTAPLWPGRNVGTHTLDWERTFDHQSFYRWYFKPACARAGLTDVRFHDLRHSYASMLLAAGVEVYKVSRWMGHANISTTDSIYAHLYPGDHTADADRLVAYLKRSAGRGSPDIRPQSGADSVPAAAGSTRRELSAAHRPVGPAR